MFGTFLLLSLSDWFQINGIISIPLGFRHVILFVVFFILFISSSRKNYSLSKIFALSISILLLISFIIFSFQDLRNLNFFFGFFFTFLFVFIYFFSSHIKLNRKTLNNLIIYIVYTLLILGIIPFIQAVYNFESMRWYPGFFRELGALGGAMNLGIILSLFLYISNKKKKYVLIAFIFSIIVFATILKKSIIGSIFIWVIFILFYRKIFNLKKIYLILLLFLFIVIPFIGQDLIDNIIENSSYLEKVGADGHVRLVMYIVSFKIAVDLFPFGSGFGTFGTPASVFNSYSEVYNIYGISDIETLAPYRVMNGFKHTLFDTYWPHILAELGFIGTVAFILVWISPIIKSKKYFRRSGYSKNSRLIYFTTLSIISVISFDGITLFNPEIPLFIFFSHGLTSLIINTFVDIK